MEERVIRRGALAFAGMGFWLALTAVAQTPPPPEITGPFSATGKTGESFSLTLTATHRPNQFAIRSGVVPQGIRYDLGPGRFYGTPTQIGMFTLRIATANTGANGQPTVGRPFTITFNATNNPRTWAVQSGSFPTGLRADLFGGTFSGTPTEPGTFRFNLIAESAGPNDTRQWSAAAIAASAVGAFARGL